MNYVRHLNAFFELVAVDERLTPCHISTYMSLFQLWNRGHFAPSFTVSRQDVMAVCKIGSAHTYYKCLHELHSFGYIVYRPSNNPLRGSEVMVQDLSDGFATDDEADEAITDSQDSSSHPIFVGTPRQSEDVVEQQMPGNQCKNDTGRAQLVHPFINNINRINSKQRERRARDFFYKDLIFEKGKVEGQAFTPTTKVSMNALLESARKKELPGGGLETQVPGKKDLPVKEKENIPAVVKLPIPTLAEIQSYFRSGEVNGISGRGIYLPDQEALKFFHHYEANGWLVGGRTPMRNWKAACHSWVMKIPAFTQHQSMMNCDPATGITPRNQGLHIVLKKNYAQPL